MVLVREKEKCYRGLASYQGTVNTTINGLTCQRWDTQKPHRHYFKPENYWWENFLLNNYCRVPDHQGIPWCYTTDPNVRREDCDVNLKECVNGKGFHLGNSDDVKSVC